MFNKITARPTTFTTETIILWYDRVESVQQVQQAKQARQRQTFVYEYVRHCQTDRFALDVSKRWNDVRLVGVCMCKCVCV